MFFQQEIKIVEIELKFVNDPSDYNELWSFSKIKKKPLRERKIARKMRTGEICNKKNPEKKNSLQLCHPSSWSGIMIAWEETMATGAPWGQWTRTYFFLEIVCLKVCLDSFSCSSTPARIRNTVRKWLGSRDSRNMHLFIWRWLGRGRQNTGAGNGSVGITSK